MGSRCADHVTPLNPQKLALTSPTGGGRSVSIVRVQTKATEFMLVKEKNYRKLFSHFWSPIVMKITISTKTTITIM